MKVAIITQNAKANAFRGIGVYTRELAGHLKNIRERNFKIKLVQEDAMGFKGYDIIHYPDFRIYFSFSKIYENYKTVITIHDVIPLIYPKAYPPGLKGRFKLLLQKILLKKIDAVITVSETSKKDIVRFLAIPESKIFKIYEAPREIFKPIIDKKNLGDIKKKFHLPEKFVLYAGDVNYNKNVGGLAEACKIAKTPLVIVGKQAASENFDREHPENKPLVDLLEKYGNDPGVLRLGFVDDDDLVGIYNLASAYCQPSFYEGFGLPVLEAFACECPVVAAKTQALVEIGEPACIFCDPKDVADIAKKITQVVEDSKLRNQLIERGKVLVKNYSWEKTAKATLEVYKKVNGG